ncbi:MAG: 1-deoxy-D-xylulose-5-phosphate reductoisomerase [Mogibacterium sp.]|nr:1-deoxy-D-xylulose-5-phosphate reductoisomerase [Mogibacterium sp.]
MKRIIILGSTGSIGTQALDIIRDNSDKFKAVALSCNSRVDELIRQVEEFHPEAVCVGKEADAKRVSELFPWLTVLYGKEGLKELVKIEGEMVLSSLMGISGLEPTYEAIKTGKDIALANKETLVTGGAIVTELCKEKGVKLLPVDSEHSAIFQCIQGNREQKIKRILLTCSGGPFRNYSAEELKTVTVEQALKHPKWNMGSKITIDSATMMNKGLEVIEAKWLFDVEPEKIDVHIHPQSIVHSMVEFEDTSVIAQLGLPDMRIPISYAFGYPDRLPYKGEGLDFFTTGANLTFEKPRRDVFKCIDLAYEALKKGGSYPIVLNGANEELVAMFLKGSIGFTDIQNTVEKVMNEHSISHPSNVEEVLSVDAEARIRAREIVRG